MSDNPEQLLPVRRNPAQGVHIEFDRTNLVLLTITAKDRIPWLADETVHRLLHETWLKATAWVVGDYLLMPDHLHLFCAPRDLQITLETWIRFWKRDFSLRHGRKVWRFQSRGWHHRLRHGESYSEKWQYVRENPLRQGLVKRMDDWKFKGRIFDLVWTGD